MTQVEYLQIIFADLGYDTSKQRSGCRIAKSHFFNAVCDECTEFARSK